MGPQGPAGTPDPSSFYTKAESDSRFASQATVAALQARIDALEAKLAAVSYDSGAKLLRVTGANVQIVDGTGDTGGTPNGLGNLIVGYNADSGEANDRSGSHNLVVGDDHTYTRFGGLVAGIRNTISGDWASVSGGVQNVASGSSAAVSGGVSNVASGPFSAASGGSSALASGNSASVSGGTRNIASGPESSISGGEGNQATAYRSSAGGGRDNAATAYGASVSGGFGNEATGNYSSVSGGVDNNATGYYASVSGGDTNTAASNSQWLGGTVVSRSAQVVVPGGAAGNGDYATRAASANCLTGELLFGGAALWVNEINDDEHPLISTHPTTPLTGWTARGGNDTSVDRTLTVQAICLGP